MDRILYIPDIAKIDPEHQVFYRVRFLRVMSARRQTGENEVPRFLCMYSNLKTSQGNKTTELLGDLKFHVVVVTL